MANHKRKRSKHRQPAYSLGQPVRITGIAGNRAVAEQFANSKRRKFAADEIAQALEEMAATEKQNSSPQPGQ